MSDVIQFPRTRLNAQEFCDELLRMETKLLCNRGLCEGPTEKYLLDAAEYAVQRLRHHIQFRNDHPKGAA